MKKNFYLQDPLQIYSAFKKACQNEESTTFSPSILLIAAHPDDEVLCASSILKKFKDNIFIIYVTSGSPKDLRDANKLGFVDRNSYSEARRNEAGLALKHLGIDLCRILHLGFDDQEVSSFVYDLADKILGKIRRLKPDILISHPYEGGHPDHDSINVAVSIARSSLKEREHHPLFLEFASYNNFMGHPSFLEFIPNEKVEEIEISLTPDTQKLKEETLGFFATQREMIKNFPRTIERFRIMPDYDYSLRPHEGSMFYEIIGWHLNFTSWSGVIRKNLGYEGWRTH